MKLGLLGSGKTGGKVLELFPQAIIFDRNTPPTLERLKELSVVISFLPGDAFLSYIPLLIESGRPVVTGSTGFSWPENIDEELRSKNLKWIYGHNFSLGMNLIFKMISILGKAPTLFSQIDFSIHEVHHTKKLDAPSGTALKWRDWLGQEATITSERVGDVVGDHILTMKTAHEEITLRHQATDRKIFAEGALWAAKKLCNDEAIEPGLHRFEDISLKELL